MTDPLPIRRDYSTHTTEALARLAHNRGHGSYGADSELAMIVAELARRQARLEATDAAMTREMA